MPSDPDKLKVATAYQAIGEALKTRDGWDESCQKHFDALLISMEKTQKLAENLARRVKK
jgi:hypothetical protein